MRNVPVINGRYPQVSQLFIDQFMLGGGIDRATPIIAIKKGRLKDGVNVEANANGGYSRIIGYTKFDANEVPGEGALLGVWRYNNKTYAFRNAVGNATAVMYESSGSGWTERKAGLTPSGNYEFINYPFGGVEKMYGVSGVHKAFEWDGTTWTDITTGMTVDTPNHLHAHRNHLFLAFGRSLQNSPIGAPTSTWTVITGAAERVMNNPITGFASLPNGTLGIFTEKEISVLAGTSSADWTAADMSEYGNNIGAAVGSIQQMGSKIRFMDSRGVTDMEASQASSDMQDAMISGDVDPLIQGKFRSVTASTIVREKTQYRLFFNDGTGLIFAFAKNGAPMITKMQFPHTVNRTCNSEDSDGNELILFGSDDGYVRVMESGNSFDGQAIDFLMITALTNNGRPGQVKRYRRLRADVSARGVVTVYARADFHIGHDDGSRPTETVITILNSATPLGLAILGQTILGASVITEGNIDIDGHGDWVSFRFFGSTTTEQPWTISSLVVEYFLGRRRR